MSESSERICPTVEAAEITKWLPWQLGLGDWDVVGMNHYHVGGERRLFVAMTNGFKCIRAEGADENEVFKVLRLAAEAHDAAPPEGEQSTP
jgi:hypothetical protein